MQTTDLKALCRKRPPMARDDSQLLAKTRCSDSLVDRYNSSKAHWNRTVNRQ